MEQLEELKRLLTLAASDDVTDFNKILTLANDLARHDGDNVRFTVDASHISRLGIELVSKQETAVAELIKNAFDADATNVDLNFKDSMSKGGTLEIVDNGHGMSRDQLLNGFMRISTQDKVLAPVSVKYKRQKAGRKGIGRFATQRLGKSLVIKTQLESEADSVILEIDWDLFEGGKDLYLISNQIKSAPKLTRPGTTIRIENLRDAWSEAQIQRAYRYIAELLQPFPLDEKKPNNSDDPGFKVQFYREQNGTTNLIADEEQSIYAHAYAQISGHVGPDGSAKISISSEKLHIAIEDQDLQFEPKLKPKTGVDLRSYPSLNGVYFRAHYFIQDELPAGTRTMVREILSRQGGMRVYRNGFRVLPYGEVFDDWLGFQRSSALRELLPPHHNHNFLGFVEITDVTGVQFEETASREGLLENDAFLQLQDFVYRALMAGVIVLARARGKKIFSTDESNGITGKRDKEKKDPRAKAADIADKLRAAAAGGNDRKNQANNDTSGDISKLNDLAKVVEELGEESQEFLEEIGMLRVLASLGLTIGEFTHEVRHALAALISTLGRMENEGPSPDLVISSKNNMLLLQSYVRYFDNAIAHNAHRTLAVYEVRDLINEFIEVVRPTLIKQNIEITKHFNGYDLFTRPMHKSEWSSILLNLLSNSLKAIQRANVTGKINIVAGATDNMLYIDFSDNGDGIPKESTDKVFDAFFTTSAPPGVMSSDSEKLVGTGLGLKIVRDIIDAANGEISLIQPPTGYSTCFRVEVPLASEEEIGDARY